MSQQILFAFSLQPVIPCFDDDVWVASQITVCQVKPDMIDPAYKSQAAEFFNTSGNGFSTQTVCFIPHLSLIVLLVSLYAYMNRLALEESP